MGQLSRWDFEIEKYVQNQEIVDYINTLMGSQQVEKIPRAILAAKVIFRDVLLAL